ALGDEITARTLLEEALTLAKEAGYKTDIAQALCLCGYLALRQNQVAQARPLYEECMATLLRVKWRTIIVRSVLASCLEGMGAVALIQGQVFWTVRLFAAAEALRTMNGYRNPIGIEKEFYERTLAEAHIRLDQETFAALWTEG